MSWNTLGLLIKAVYLFAAIDILLFLLLTAFPYVAPIFWCSVIVSSLFVLTGLLGGATAVLYHVGLVKMTCPLCGSPATLIGIGNYTFLRCPVCGDVHAIGFFKTRYLVASDDSVEQPPII
jgi:hypothetical protein